MTTRRRITIPARMLLLLWSLPVVARSRRLEGSASVLPFLEQNHVVVMNAASVPLAERWDWVWLDNKQYYRFNGTGEIGPSSPLIYPFLISNPGTYRLILRAHDNNVEDCFTKLLGYPGYEGEFTKTFVLGESFDTVHEYQTYEDQKLVDHQAIPRYSFTDPGWYELHVAGRSSNFSLDRIVLYDEDHGLPDLEQSESIQGASPSQVKSFALYEAGVENGQRIKELSDGETIDLNSYNTAVTVVAETHGYISFARFEFDETENTEHKAPLALYGRNVDTLAPVPYLQYEGLKTVKVTAYNSYQEHIGISEVTFQVVGSSPPLPSQESFIKELILVQANTAEVVSLGEVRDGRVIDLSEYENVGLSIVAQTQGDVDRIKFFYNGKVHPSRHPPFAMLSHDGTHYTQVPFLDYAGEKIVRAVAYDSNGNNLGQYKATFVVVGEHGASLPVDSEETTTEAPSIMRRTTEIPTTYIPSTATPVAPKPEAPIAPTAPTNEPTLAPFLSTPPTEDKDNGTGAPILTETQTRNKPLNSNDAPFAAPTNAPSLSSTKNPVATTTSTPETPQPSLRGAATPTSAPTRALLNSSPEEALPTKSPSKIPSLTTLVPSLPPTKQPTLVPSLPPTKQPSSAPSLPPTKQPTMAPSLPPTMQPTLAPSLPPTMQPTMAPSLPPTMQPTLAPSLPPTKQPTLAPSLPPSKSPTRSPTPVPTAPPTHISTTRKSPTFPPTVRPTTAATSAPSLPPSKSPTRSPTPVPTAPPTPVPTAPPTPIPTKRPTGRPTTAPTKLPTESPTKNPSSAPSASPTIYVEDCDRSCSTELFGDGFIMKKFRDEDGSCYDMCVPEVLTQIAKTYSFACDYCPL